MGRFDEDYPIPPRWLFESDKHFPELRDFLSKLPFRRLSHCNILRQLQTVPPHIDYDSRLEAMPGPHSHRLEPASYKILLYGANLDSFFVCDPKHEGSRRFPQYPPGHQCFAVSDSQYWHGAEYFPGEPKYIVSIFGLLDEAAHDKLIRESFELFNRYAITF